MPEPYHRPVLVYDGQCAFCSRWVDSWRRRLGGALDFLPAAEATERLTWLTPESAAAAVQFVQSDGRVLSGAAAVYRALAEGGHPWPWRVYRRVPGFAFVAESAYRFIARRRQAIGRVDKRIFDGHRRARLSRWQALHVVTFSYPALLFAGTTFAAAVVQRRRRGLLDRLLHRRRRPTTATRELFLRGLGVSYLAAFASLLVQIRGLAGERGILPAADYLDFIRHYHADRRYAIAPTLLWLDASDRALVAMCMTGVALSALLARGVAPLPVLAVLWASYLSLSVAGQTFLQFQWDALLLETGLLAMLYAPLRLNPSSSREAPPAPIATWLLRWLLFRVMFSSGMVKIASHDRSWRAATALEYHYQTQPLPTWTSYYAHHLPRWFHRLSVYGVWFCEVVVPPFGLATRRARKAAFVSTVVLQALIAATGNYGFFNLLTAALALPLLDDDQLPRWVRDRLPSGRPAQGRLARHRAEGGHLGPTIVRWAIAPVGAGLFVLGMVPLASSIALEVRWPRRLTRFYARVAPWSLANPYGLFAVMTTRRPELIVEGSDDGERWLPYGFKWKPGDPARRPRFTPFHLPRLDWLMWFAALSPAAQLDWLQPFLARLLENSPEVIALLRRNPFPKQPPRFLRVRVFRYQFASREEHARTGRWWDRELIGKIAQFERPRVAARFADRHPPPPPRA